MTKVLINLSIILLFTSGLFAQGKTVPMSKLRENAEKNRRVIEQLKELLEPSRLNVKTKSPRTTSASPPYIKIIKGSNNRSTIIYQCRNTQATSLVNALESIVTSRGMVEPSEEQNLVIVNDNSDNIDVLKESLLAMDVKPPQILVEAKIVEVILEEGVDRDMRIMFEQYNKDLNTTSRYGVNLEAPEPYKPPSTEGIIGSGADFIPYTSGKLGDNWQKFNIAIKWLLHARETKILSSPNLIVNIGTTASIVTGQDIPIQESQIVSGSISMSIEFKRVGVKLNVTPLLINGDMVYLQINPEVSQVIRYEKFYQGETVIQNPVIAIRNINTELRMNDGEIIMLGGLYSNSKTNSTESPPVLGDIPYIGDLLTARSAKTDVTQLIFFLKISVLKNEPGDEFYDPGKQATEVRKIGDLIKHSKEIFPQNDVSPMQRAADRLRLFGNYVDKLREKVNNAGKDKSRLE